MVRFRKLKHSDIGGIANLIQTRHINKYISEQTNIHVYITQQSNKRVRVNGFNNIEPLHKNAPRAA